MSNIKYDNKGRILNIKVCPFCGELREVHDGINYYCDTAGVSFEATDLITVKEFAGLVNHQQILKEAIEEAYRYQRYDLDGDYPDDQMPIPSELYHKYGLQPESD